MAGLEGALATRGTTRGFFGDVRLKVIEVVSGKAVDKIADFGASAIRRRARRGCESRRAKAVGLDFVNPAGPSRRLRGKHNSRRLNSRDGDIAPKLMAMTTQISVVLCEHNAGHRCARGPAGVASGGFNQYHRMTAI
jgi:hypothetical protein